MATSRLLGVLLAALALGVAAAACGEKDEAETTAPSAEVETTTAAANGGDGDAAGGGQGGGPSAQDEVANVLEAVIGGADPQLACAELVTDRYLRQAYGDAQGCRAAVSAQGSFAVEVEKVEIQGEGASATAKPQGGPNKGETIDSELVLEGGAWKVDSLRSNAPPGP